MRDDFLEISFFPNFLCFIISIDGSKNQFSLKENGCRNIIYNVFCVAIKIVLNHTVIIPKIAVKFVAVFINKPSMDSSCDFNACNLTLNHFQKIALNIIRWQVFEFCHGFQ